jgi:cell division septum initiation protein DivIVA
MRLSVVDQVFGANKAPIETVLAADFADLIRDVNGLTEQADALPTKIKGDEDMGRVGQAVTDLRALHKRVDGARSDEKAPILDAGKKLDGWFKDLTAKIEASAKRLQGAADDYARAKAAEERARLIEESRKAREKAAAEAAKAEAGNVKAAGRAEQAEARAETAEAAAGAKAADLVRTRAGGVTSSAKTVWTFRVDDYPALQSSLGPLGPFLAREDVEKAIRSVVRIQKGGTALPGVTVFEDVKSTFRR